jgi:flagellar basal body-associated protein FliL
MKDPKILGGGAVLFAVLFWFVLKPMFFGGESIPPVYTDEQLSAAPRPTLILEERVLNLKSDVEAPNYVKLILALEFEDPELHFMGLSGESLVKGNEVFAEEMSPSTPRIWDVVTFVIGGRTLEEVSDVEMREDLKEELIEAINEQLHEEQVENVYFVAFVTQ